MSFCAGVVELVDTPDLGSGGESRGGSSPFTRTNIVRLYNLCGLVNKIRINSLSLMKGSFSDEAGSN